MIKYTRDKISWESNLNSNTADITESASAKVSSLNKDEIPFGKNISINDNLTDPLQICMTDVCTVPMSLAGVPAFNISAGKSKNNLPIELQLTGNFFQREGSI